MCSTQVRRLEYRNLAFRPRRHLSLKVYAVCPKEVDERDGSKAAALSLPYTSLPASFFSDVAYKARNRRI